jgi:hypothetical protein
MAAFKLLLALLAVEASLADPKPGLLDVLASLNLTKFADGLKKCNLDRVINHEGFILFT